LLAADESVRRAEDPMDIAGLVGGPNIVVLKGKPLGGVRRMAWKSPEACGCLPVVVSSRRVENVGRGSPLVCRG